MKNHYNPEPFNRNLNPGASNPAPPSEDNVTNCALEIQKYTSCGFPACLFFTLALLSAVIGGSRLTIGGHVTWCASLYIFSGYNWATRLLLGIGAQILLPNRGTNSRRNTFSVGSALEDVGGQFPRSNHHVVVGTEGPFRAFSTAALPALDRLAFAIRGQFAEQRPLITGIMAATADDMIHATEVGRSLNLASIMTYVSVDPDLNTVPAALENVRDLLLFRLIGPPCCGIADRGPFDFTFTAEAEALILAAVRGRESGDDDLRKIGTTAAALKVASQPWVGTLIDGATASRAIEYWQQSEAAMSELLGSVPASAMTLTDDLKVRAQRILDYCSRSGITEVSPRDVVLHGFSANVADAQLLLAYLETRGLAKQVRYILNGRPLQKWLVNTPRLPPARGDENTEEPGGNVPKAPLTNPPGGGAASAVADVVESAAQAITATGGDAQ